MTTKLISITPNIESTIAYCARVSSSNQNKEDIISLLKYCYIHKHFSIFEMGNMTLEIETSRAISAQLLRHRSMNFQEFSQRYASVDESGVIIYAARRQDTKNRQNSIDDLPLEIKEEWERRQHDNWKISFEHYLWAINNGIAKECARFVLPMASKTKIMVNGTIRSWIHYLDLRTGNGSQKEHIDLALEMRNIFIENLPILSKVMEWKK